MSDLHDTDILIWSERQAELLRQEEDGAWPDNPIALTLGDDVALESIDSTAPIAAFYRTV